MSNVVAFRSRPWPDQRRPEHAKLLNDYIEGRLKTVAFLAHIGADPAFAAFVKRWMRTRGIA